MPKGYKSAAAAILIGVALHFLAFVLGGGIGMIVGAVIWTGVATGLNRGMRWVAYLGFVLALIGISAAMITLLNTSVPLIVTLGIVAIDMIIAVMLFRVLWRPSVAA